jgi:hypothetical protein
LSIGFSNGPIEKRVQDEGSYRSDEKQDGDEGRSHPHRIDGDLGQADPRATPQEDCRRQEDQASKDTGGQVKNGECVCPEGYDTKQTGTNAYACVKTPPEITCTGGKVKDGRCVCPKGTNFTSTGNNAFACVKPSTGGASEGSTGGTGGTSGGSTGGPPTFKLPQGGLVPR